MSILSDRASQGRLAELTQAPLFCFRRASFGGRQLLASQQVVCKDTRWGPLCGRSQYLLHLAPGKSLELVVVVLASVLPCPQLYKVDNDFGIAQEPSETRQKPSYSGWRRREHCGASMCLMMHGSFSHSPALRTLQQQQATLW